MDYNVTKTGVRLMAEENSIDGERLILGDDSFGALLAKYGVPSVPSPDEPTPGNPFWVPGPFRTLFSMLIGEVNYFRGGYITQTYGSRDGDSLTDALQLETPATEVPDVEMAEGIGRAIVDYHNLFYA